MSQNQASNPADAKPTTVVSRIAALIPGNPPVHRRGRYLGLLERAELGVFEHPYVEALVMAILLGMALRSFWKPAPRWQAGIAFSAKQLLEVAVMLLGASISFAAIAASGVALLGVDRRGRRDLARVSFGISRMLGLSTRLSILIACGNSICGNSAIAAVAPIIGANNDEIASSISFTAILGVMMVLGLPLLIPLLQLSATQYGILAGLTVYAVPQVTTKLANEFISSGQYDDVQGIWTSGIDSRGRRRHQGRRQEVRADRRHRPRLVRQAAARPDQLSRPRGRRRHQHRRRRRRRRQPGAQAPQRRDGQRPTVRQQPNTVLLDPVARRQRDRRGQADPPVLASVNGLDPTWPLGLADRRLDDLHP